MHQGKYVFAQITEFLPGRVYDLIVQKYHGNKHTRTFTCWNQMLCMVFGQLTNRDSLRDLIVALDAHKAKDYNAIEDRQQALPNGWVLLVRSASPLWGYFFKCGLFN